jgi:hypothetical protein
LKNFAVLDLILDSLLLGYYLAFSFCFWSGKRGKIYGIFQTYLIMNREKKREGGREVEREGGNVCLVFA